MGFLAPKYAALCMLLVFMLLVYLRLCACWDACVDLCLLGCLLGPTCAWFEPFGVARSTHRLLFDEICHVWCCFFAVVLLPRRLGEPRAGNATG